VEIRRGLQSLPLDVGPTAVTVGFFDGVHRGHQAVLGRTVQVGRERGLPPVAITFDRHPREVLTPGKEPPLLTTLDRKASLIAAVGIEDLVVLEFNEAFARWPPEDFVERVLVAGLHMAHAVIGSNFTFGHKASGNLTLLAEWGPAHGFYVEGVSLFQVGGRTVSSSSIREALAAGDLVWPTEALGRRFVVDGRVVPGAGRGATTLGFPTANLHVPPRMLIPGGGVYAGKAHVRGEEYVAAINVGTNPTFGEEPLHVEAHLLDFQGGDLTGVPLAVEFWERLRDEVRFNSAEELARRIAEDVARTRAAVPRERVAEQASREPGAGRVVG
jgi:riboflavin kinase/FMN adenylyltransferase